MQVGEGRVKLAVSVRPRTYDALRELAERLGKPHGRVIDELVRRATAEPAVEIPKIELRGGHP
jgi:hypothetical protein